MSSESRRMVRDGDGRWVNWPWSSLLNESVRTGVDRAGCPPLEGLQFEERSVSSDQAALSVCDSMKQSGTARDLWPASLGSSGDAGFLSLNKALTRKLPSA